MSHPHLVYASDVIVVSTLRDRHHRKLPFGLTPPQKTALARHISPPNRHPHIDDHGRRTYLG